MLDLIGPISSGLASWGSGAAAASHTTVPEMYGHLAAVYVQYNDSPPVTSDLTISTVGTSPSAPAITLLSLSNANSDGWYYPRVALHTPEGGLAGSLYSYVPVYDRITVAVAQADDGDSVDVWLLIEGAEHRHRRRLI